MSRPRDMERAIKGLRFTTSNEADARIRQHLSAARLQVDRQHSEPKHSTLREIIRISVMSTKTRYAAAAIIVIAAALALSLTINGSGNIAFADVIRNVEAVRTVTWRQTVEFGGRTSTWEYQATGSGRVRSTVDGLVTILDVANGKLLFLDRELKLAALQDVPQSLYDAASIDGANAWHKIRHVTLPLLTPALFFLLVTGMIGAAQSFTASFFVTQGGPADSTLMYGLYLYRIGFERFRMGYACTLAWVLLVVVGLLTVLLFRTSNRWVFYSEGGA